MKRLMVLLGIFCLLTFCLSGCGGSAPESDMDASSAEEALDTAGQDLEAAGSLAEEASEIAADAAKEAVDAAGDAVEDLNK